MRWLTPYGSRGLIVAVVAVAITAGPARAQADSAGVAAGTQVTARFTPEVERTASTLFTEIMSPYCPGMTLTTCPSEGAFVLKDEIRAQLSVGRTPEQVMEGLERRFGPEVRARPRPEGMGLVAWVGPFVALGAGALAITWWIRRESRRRRATGPRPLPPELTLDDDTRARLAAALRDDG
jgi:cytochrome c-type biogenesis protein CcmH/NrfF